LFYNVLYPRTGKTLFFASSILPNEELVNVAIRVLHDETGLILTSDDLTMLSDAPLRVALPDKERQLAYVFSAYVPFAYVTTHLRTQAQLEEAVIAKSTLINADGSYVVPETIDIDGRSLAPAKTGLLLAVKHKSELLHFGYVIKWGASRRYVCTQ
jgi:ADP-ribose pyrophosphatase YjhB (NUDIX family)